jgi:NitT/TauT family transport system ATP-binding protein
MEIVNNNGGCMDVFALDQLTEYDFGHTLGVVKAGEMLDFLDTPKNLVVLTPTGRSFLAADVNARKELINRQIRALETFRFVTQILREASDTRLPKEIIIEELAIRLPGQDYERLFETIVGWGRYAELLGYEPQSEILYLDQPSTPAPSAETPA